MPRAVPAKPSRARRMAELRPRVKVWLEAEHEVVVCRRMVELLQAVDETGSIKEAAGRVGRSYRHVWDQIKGAESALAARLVQTHVGGRGTQRSELTPLARDLMSCFSELREEVLALVDQTLADRLSQLLRRHRRSPPA
jgi:molybdate transport system regulatory protein